MSEYNSEYESDQECDKKANRQYIEMIKPDSYNKETLIQLDINQYTKETEQRTMLSEGTGVRIEQFIKSLANIQTTYNANRNTNMPDCVFRCDSIRSKWFSWGHIPSELNGKELNKKIQYMLTKQNGESAQSKHQVVYKTANINLFFDLDFKELFDNNGYADVNQIKDDFETALKSAFKYIGQDNIKYKIYYQANSQNKGLHIHLKGIKTNLHILKYFASIVSTKFVLLNTEIYTNKFIDLQVYRLGGSLRLVGNKYNDNQILVNSYAMSSECKQYLLYRNDELDTFIPIANYLINEYTQFYNPKGNDVTQLENLEFTDTYFNMYKKLILNAFNDINVKIVFMEGRLGKQIKYLQQECPICLRHHQNEVNRNLQIKMNPKYITVFCFQNKKGDDHKKSITIVISPDQEKATAMDKLAYNLGMKSQDITSSLKDQIMRKVNTTYAEQPIKIQDVEMTLQQIAQFFKKRTDLFIISQMMTGKSKLQHALTTKALEQKMSVLHITSRQTFTLNKSKQYGAINYIENKCLFVEPGAQLMCQYEAVDKVIINKGYPDIIVFDEFVSGLQHLSGSDYMTYGRYTKLIDLIQNAKHIIVIDAYLEDRHFHLFESLRNTQSSDGNKIWDHIRIQNNHRPLLNKAQATVQIGIPENEHLFVKTLALQIKTTSVLKNQKTVIFTTKKKYGYRLQEQLTALGLKTLYLNGDNEKPNNWNDDENTLHRKFKHDILENPQTINDYEVCIYTQTIGIGVSFELHEQFQNIIVLCSQSLVMGANDVIQSVFRFRNIQNIHIYTFGFKFQKKVTSIAQAHQIFKRIAKDDLDIVLPEVNNKIYEFQLYQYLETSIQHSEFVLKLVQYLLNMGVSVTDIVQPIFNQQNEFQSICQNTKQDFKIGDYLIGPADLRKNNTQTLQYYGINIGAWECNKETLRLIYQLKIFKPSVHFIFSEDDTHEDNTTYIQEINKHLEEYRDDYYEISKYHHSDQALVFHYIKSSPQPTLHQAINTVIQQFKISVDKTDHKQDIHDKYEPMIAEFNILNQQIKDQLQTQLNEMYKEHNITKHNDIQKKKITEQYTFRMKGQEQDIITNKQQKIRAIFNEKAHQLNDQYHTQFAQYQHEIATFCEYGSKDITVKNIESIGKLMHLSKLYQTIETIKPNRQTLLNALYNNKQLSTLGNTDEIKSTTDKKIIKLLQNTPFKAKYIGFQKRLTDNFKIATNVNEELYDIPYGTAIINWDAIMLVPRHEQYINKMCNSYQSKRLNTKTVTLDLDPKDAKRLRNHLNKDIKTAAQKLKRAQAKLNKQ